MADAGVALCIARFSLPDRAAVESLRASLTHGGRCVVALRDAFQARSARCPFTWEERAEMLAAALQPATPDRVSFVALREHYDEDRSVDDLLLAVAPGDVEVDVHWAGEHDARLERALAQRTLWRLHAQAEPSEPRALQDRLFASDDAGKVPEAVRELLTGEVVQRLPEWLRHVDYASLRAEHLQLRREQQQWACVPYPVTLVTVDAVVRAGGQVLLIRRGRAPGKGLRALPGGFLEPGDTVYDSAVRELQEETQVALTPQQARERLRGVQVFDHPRRSQRGNRVITHAHYFDLGDTAPPQVEGGDDAAAAEWVPLARLAEMEAEFLDDHFEILRYFLDEEMSTAQA